MASGTDLSCDIHAFFIQWTIMTPIYNASLSLYYVLVVRLGWNERKIHKVRYWFHILPVCISLGTAIAGLVLNIYGNASLWCWIVSGSVYRWAFYYGILWFCALVIIIPSMTIVYLHVHKQEKAAAKWQRKSGQDTSYVNSKVATQGLFFAGAFVITWIFPTLTRLMQAITGTAPFGLILCMCIFLPMQGLINALVFLRPKYVKYRKDNPDKSVWYASRRALFGRKKESVIVTMFGNRSSTGGNNKSGISRLSSFGDEKESVAVEAAVVEADNENGKIDRTKDLESADKAVVWADEEEKREEEDEEEEYEEENANPVNISGVSLMIGSMDELTNSNDVDGDKEEDQVGEDQVTEEIKDKAKAGEEKVDEDKLIV